MKKIIFSILFTVVYTTCIYADGLTATLQNGDDMKPFYGVDAFKDAVKEAVDGSIITLSPGVFTAIDSITKTITLRGSYGFDPTNNDVTILSKIGVYANNVTIEGVHVSGNLIIGNVTDCHIKRCYIEGNLNSADGAHTNTLIDQCSVTKDFAISNGNNYCLRNSTIGSFGKINTAGNIAYISNCTIYDFYYNHGSPSEGVQGVVVYPNIPYAIYKNNVLGIDITSYYYHDYAYYYYFVKFTSPNEFYNNNFTINRYNARSNYAASYRYTPDNQIQFESGCINSNNTTSSYSSVLPNKIYPSNPKDPGNGQDGTVRGPYGGTGFSEYPAIPRVLSKDIDTSTDTDGNIKAKITVKVQQ